MGIEFRPLTPTIGAEVRGIDLAGPISEADFQRLHEAWLRHTILLFRDQAHIGPADHIAFTRRFGALEMHTLPRFTHPEHPEIFVLSNAEKQGKPLGAPKSGRHWHSDSHFLKEPSGGSLLLAREVPPEGGDTLFANMYAAYEALPAETRRRIDHARVRVSRVKAWPISYPDRPPLTEEEKASLPDVTHPLVRIHPESSRPSLFIGGNVVWEILDMDFQEGRRLLDELRQHATQPEFVYRHRWKVGDAILWDNRCTMHCATGFDESRYIRLMHRTTLAGAAPIPKERTKVA